ncbi:MAG: hypothetical protein H0X50_11255 [Nitrosopumilus sp.]|nr:hypothetical protein [Nitrosopumilus sp.]
MKSKKVTSASVVILVAIALMLTINSSFAQTSNKTDIIVDGEREVKNYSTTSKESTMLEGTGTSKYGKYKVQVNWTSDYTGSENVFNIHFLDAKTGIELPGLTYSVMLFKGEISLLDGTIRKNQTSPQQIYMFKEEGIYNLRISSIDGTREKIDFPFQIKLRQP